MLRIQKGRELSEEVEFELSGHRFSHILAEITSPYALLDSSGEVFGHRYADLARPAHQPKPTRIRRAGAEKPHRRSLEIGRSVSEIVCDGLQLRQRSLVVGGPLRRRDRR